MSIFRPAKHEILADSQRRLQELLANAHWLDVLAALSNTEYLWANRIIEAVRAGDMMALGCGIHVALCAHYAREAVDAAEQEADRQEDENRAKYGRPVLVV